MSLFHQASFITSAHTLDQCLPDTGAEIAFAGRSNAGKSSAINALTRQNHLCKTSKTPGRTQLINFFKLTDDHRLVDLPGYGYAKVSKSMRAHWDETLSQFLLERQSLKGIVIVVDIRRGLTDMDISLMELLYGTLEIHILLAKADKLKKGARIKALKEISDDLNGAGITIHAFSSVTKEGMDELQEICYKMLDLTLKV